MELASVSDEALVAPAIATALGLQLRSNRDPSDVLVDHIGARRLLLVIDNCEHLIDACARVIARLESACRNAVVVATSREPLHIARRARVAGAFALAAGPGPAVVVGGGAALLPARAEASEADVPAVAEICLRLDGMPLAIELAAARAGILAPSQIAERLGDSLALLRSGRPRGAHAPADAAGARWPGVTICSRDSERTLFRRLSVFAGTFDIDAAECVGAGDGTEAAEVVDLLGRLVDKSLVQCDRHRYRLLETVRQYGRERLRESGEADRLEAAHRHCYAARVEAGDLTRGARSRSRRPARRAGVGARPRPARGAADGDRAGGVLAGPRALRRRGSLARAGARRGTRADRRFERVHCSRRARSMCGAERPSASWSSATRAWRSSAGAATVKASRGRSGSSGCCRWSRASSQTGRRTFDASIDLGDVATAAGGRLGQGVIAYCQGDYAGARGLLDTSLELFAGVPDEPGERFRATHANPVVTLEGPDGAPRSVFEDTLHTFRPIGVRAAAAYASVNLAEAWRAEGRYEPARASLERALEEFREVEDAAGVAAAGTALGNLARSAGDVAGGAYLLEEALAIRRELGDRRDIGMSLASVGLLHARAGDADAARAAIREADEIFQETEDHPGLAGMLQDLGWVELETGDPAAAIELLERSVVKWREQVIIRGAGWTAAMLAEAAEAADDPPRARRALREAVEAFRRVGEARGLAHAEALAQRLQMAR